MSAAIVSATVPVTVMAVAAAVVVATVNSLVIGTGNNVADNGMRGENIEEKEVEEQGEVKAAAGRKWGWMRQRRGGLRRQGQKGYRRPSSRRQG
jgi:hypothetical protein